MNLKLYSNKLIINNIEWSLNYKIDSLYWTINNLKRLLEHINYKIVEHINYKIVLK